MGSNYVENWDYTFKIVIIGDSGVGKSCILYRFADDSFDDSHLHTIGVDFKIRTIQIEDKIVKLQTWDTAGQDRFLSITTSYYRGADGILIVYDVTDKLSFENVNKWRNEVNKHAKENVDVLLIGNKCDLERQRVVSFEQGRDLADQLGVDFMETSAKKSNNIERAFLMMARKIYGKLPQTTSAFNNKSVKNNNNNNNSNKLDTVKLKNTKTTTNGSKCVCII